MHPYEVEAVSGKAAFTIWETTDEGDVGVIHPQAFAVEIGMRRMPGCFRVSVIEKHNTALWCVDVDYVFIPPNVVCSVVDSQQFMPVYPIVSESDVTRFGLRYGVGWVSQALQNSGEKVLFEFGNEVLLE